MASVEALLGPESIWFHHFACAEAEECHYGKGPKPAAEKKEKKEKKEQPKAQEKKADDDDDIDLFGEDDVVDEEAEKIKEQRLKEYAERKAKKPAVIAKSSVLLEVKPWDDETDLTKMEECVRSIEQDGLVWGASRFIPIAYGVKKLQIQCVVEDEKVSIDDLSEKISGFEDYVQSVDVAAFNKV